MALEAPHVYEGVGLGCVDVPEAALLSSRREHAPQGLAGGGPALPGAQRWIAAKGAVKELPGCFSVKVQPGDVIEIETPGGGGFGAVALS